MENTQTVKPKVIKQPAHEIAIGSDSPIDLRDDAIQANLDGQTLAQIEKEKQDKLRKKRQLEDKKKAL